MNENVPQQQTEYSKAVDAAMRAMENLSGTTINLLERLKIIIPPAIPTDNANKTTDLKTATPCSLVVAHLRDITQITNQIIYNIKEVLNRMEI